MCFSLNKKKALTRQGQLKELQDSQGSCFQPAPESRRSLFLSKLEAAAAYTTLLCLHKLPEAKLSDSQLNKTLLRQLCLPERHDNVILKDKARRLWINSQIIWLSLSIFQSSLKHPSHPPQASTARGKAVAFFSYYIHLIQDTASSFQTVTRPLPNFKLLKRIYIW